MINGDHRIINQQPILNKLQPYSQTNCEFNYSKNKNHNELSHNLHHNYSNKENIYIDENQINHEIINSSHIYRDNSAYQSTDGNISLKKYYETSSMNKPTNINNQIHSNPSHNDLPRDNIPNKIYSIYDKYITQIPQDFLFEIWESLKLDESFQWIGNDFMKNQHDINEKMRAILVDWLVEVHQRFNLTPETLFLTINIIDRYISKKEILRTQLQLVGVAALFIACKYEEILCPDIRDFVYITDKSYSKTEILKMEREILIVLNFDVTVPTSFRMLEIIALNFNFNEVEFAYGKYLLESYLIDPNCNNYTPSIISCAVAYIIMKMNNYQNYQDVYKIITCNQKILKDCAKEIYYFSCNLESTQFKAVHKKYSTREFYFVATKCMASLGQNFGGSMA